MPRNERFSLPIPRILHDRSLRLFSVRIADLFRNYLITTYRKGDRADTGYREELRQLGFAERELLIEFGYPTQRFVFHAKHSETNNDK